MSRCPIWSSTAITCSARIGWRRPRNGNGRDIKVPPVMITVANRTETAARVKYAFDHGKIRIEELCAPDRTLHIDSKVLAKAEAPDRRRPTSLSSTADDEDDEERRTSPNGS